LPVIFYSGDAYEKDQQQGLAAGAQAYLVKPNDLENIAGVIGTLLQNSSSRL
jgi:CheY-like chemotaxis protein